MTPPIPSDLDHLVEFAATLADEARTLSLSWFRRPLQIDTKADDSPVTQADREIERFLRQRIAERFPKHGVLGEEHGRVHIDAEFVWVIDPIDGTRSFITGWPIFGMLLALLWQGRPVIGQIDMPSLSERWVGRQGAPTLYNGAQVHTSGRRRLGEASVYTTSPDQFAPADWAQFDRVSRMAGARRFGGDCYSFGLLAAGHIDLVIDGGLQPYDYLSLVPVIEGAGGVITDWAGQALSLKSDGRVIASATEELHAATLRALGEG